MLIYIVCIGVTKSRSCQRHQVALADEISKLVTGKSVASKMLFPFCWMWQSLGIFSDPHSCIISGHILMWAGRGVQSKHGEPYTGLVREILVGSEQEQWCCWSEMWR